MKRISFAVLALLLSAAPAKAEEARLLSKHDNWSAYVFTEAAGKVCYMASQPTKAEGNYSKRDEIFALVTNRPAEGSKNVFSYIAGYTYKPGADVTVKVNGETFTLFTQDNTAWAADAATDEKLVAALRKGSTLVVIGTSARGTKTTDTFSLKGSGAAHDAIGKECAGQ